MHLSSVLGVSDVLRSHLKLAISFILAIGTTTSLLLVLTTVINQALSHARLKYYDIEANMNGCFIGLHGLYLHLQRMVTIIERILIKIQADLSQRGLLLTGYIRDTNSRSALPSGVVTVDFMNPLSRNPVYGRFCHYNIVSFLLSQ